jgi:hypothetical protein
MTQAQLILFRENQNETRRLKWKVTNLLSIPGDEEPLIWDQADGDHGSGTLP